MGSKRTLFKGVLISPGTITPLDPMACPFNSNHCKDVSDLVGFEGNLNITYCRRVLMW